MKAVVDEVDVLRLCHSLGMAVSDEGNRALMHKFEFGMFSPNKYEADFARFIREKPGIGGRSNAEDQESNEQLEIGSLFGKQMEMKAELVRMGFWSCECEDGLSLQDQGVYCIERSGEYGGRRQFVAFAWLSANLFEPEVIRDTPAYVLRFLISLSSSITRCLSREDFQRVESEVRAASNATTMQWNSCSVAFRVQRQEQTDSVGCLKPVMASIPHSDPIKSVEFIDTMSSWLKQGNVLLEMSSFRDMIKDLYNGADMLFAIKSSTNAVQMGKAKTRYEDLLRRLDEHDVLNELDEQTVTALHMPERMQTHMRALHDALMDNSSGFEDILDEIMNGVPFHEDSSSHSGWIEGAHYVFRRVLGIDGHYSIRFQQAMETRQPRLQHHWEDAVKKAASKLGDAILNQRVYQSTTDRADQMQQNAEDLVNEAFERLRVYLSDSSCRQLEAKISALRFNADCSAANIKWSE
ncbi:hypothetical protein PC121_g21087 [Phytophthora cactorum]|nr:hypothetical protein PC121_g21087 [Phytophthora cactorum]